MNDKEKAAKIFKEILYVKWVNEYYSYSSDELRKKLQEELRVKYQKELEETGVEIPDYKLTGR